MGNSDINLLDTSKESIQGSTEEDTTELSASLIANINAILEAGKQKFEMTDDEEEAMKVLVIK